MKDLYIVSRVFRLRLYLYVFRQPICILTLPISDWICFSHLQSLCRITPRCLCCEVSIKVFPSNIRGLVSVTLLLQIQECNQVVKSTDALSFIQVLEEDKLMIVWKLKRWKKSCSAMDTSTLQNHGKLGGRPAGKIRRSWTPDN